MWFLPFSFWLTSLSMVISSCIHVAANGIILFYGWGVFHCIYASHLLYPSICWWTFSLFPCLGYHELCYCELRGASVFWITVVLWYMPRNGIVGSYMVVLFLALWGISILFSIVAAQGRKFWRWVLCLTLCLCPRVTARTPPLCLCWWVLS